MTQDFNPRRKLKIFLYLVIGITLAVILTIFIGYRFLSERPEAILDSAASKANLSLGEIHQTSTKEGVTQWVLDAASAELFHKKNLTVFKKPSVTFYTREGEEVHLTAEQGFLNLKSNDMEVKGNVILKNVDYRINTEALHYQKKMHIIRNEKPVRITGKTFTIKADSIYFDLNTGQAQLQGNVEGNFSENFIF